MFDSYIFKLLVVKINFKLLKGVLMKFLLLGLCLVGSGAFAANVPVSIKATADDDFAIVLSQGITNTMVYSSTVGNWKIPKLATIEVPNANLASCSINFITWNKMLERGFVATLSGNNGATVHTGNSAWSSFRTSASYVSYQTASSTFPSIAEIGQIFATKIASPTTVYTANDGVWGAATSLGFDPAAKWIETTGYSAPKSFNIHSLPCSSVVINLSFPQKPKPTPTPLPVDVKGDHYACYMLEKGEALKAETIEITDQFGKARAILGMPKMICNPSEKIHGKKKFGIEDKEKHLVCYEILEQSPNKDYDLQIGNQFEVRKVRSTNRELFCVPSIKKHL